MRDVDDIMGRTGGGTGARPLSAMAAPGRQQMASGVGRCTSPQARQRKAEAARGDVGRADWESGLTHCQAAPPGGHWWLARAVAVAVRTPSAPTPPPRSCPACDRVLRAARSASHARFCCAVYLPAAARCSMSATIAIPCSRTTSSGASSSSAPSSPACSSSSSSSSGSPPASATTMAPSAPKSWQPHRRRPSLLSEWHGGGMQSIVLTGRRRLVGEQGRAQ